MVILVAVSAALPTSEPTPQPPTSSQTPPPENNPPPLPNQSSQPLPQILPISLSKLYSTIENKLSPSLEQIKWDI